MATRKTTKKKLSKKAGPAPRKPAARAKKASPAKRKAAARAAKRRAPKRVAPKGAARKAPKRAAAKRRAPAPPRASAVAKKKTSRAAKAAPVRRREAGGRLPPKYAADLLAKSGRRGAEPRGFVEGNRTRDDLAEDLAEEAVSDATSGEPEAQDVRNQVVPEERGGPFVVTPAGAEFAVGTDPSNPKDADREPFPTT
jgi:hypothetical protein